MCLYISLLYSYLQVGEPSAGIFPPVLVDFIPKTHFIYFIAPLIALSNSCRGIAITENWIKAGYI